MLHSETGRRQRIPMADASEGAKLFKLANDARRFLRERKRRRYNETIAQLRIIAERMGYHLVDNRDLRGMVVGLENPSKPGYWNWIFLA